MTVLNSALYFEYTKIVAFLFRLSLKTMQCLLVFLMEPYRVLQTIQMKLTLLCVWAERAVLGSAKTALKFKYEI